MNYAASVAVGLTFMEEWHRVNPQWLSKDIIVLFYDDSQEVSGQDSIIGENYSKNVNNFLSQYYMGHERFNNNNDLKSLLDDDKLIHGRCGYLRQGYPFIIKDYDFNKLNLHIDGLNGKLSDIDYYDAARQVTSDAGFYPDVSAPSYFKSNQAISMISKFMSGDDKSKGKKGKSLRDHYLDLLNQILQLFEQRA